MKKISIFLIIFILQFLSQAKTNSENITPYLQIGTPSFLIKRANSSVKFEEKIIKGELLWDIKGIAKIYLDKQRNVKNWVNYTGKWHEATVNHYGKQLPYGKKIFLAFKENEETDIFIFEENRVSIENSLKGLGFKISKEKKDADYTLLFSFIRPSPEVDKSIESDPVYNTEYISSKTFKISGSTNSNVYSGFRHLGNIKSAKNYSISTPWDLKTVYAGQKTRTIKKTSYSFGLRVTGYIKTDGEYDKKPIFLNKVFIVKSQEKLLSKQVPYLFFYAIGGILHGGRGTLHFPLDDSNMTRALKKSGFTTAYQVSDFIPNLETIDIGCTKEEILSWCISGINQLKHIDFKKSLLYADYACKRLGNKPSCLNLIEINELQKKHKSKEKIMKQKCSSGDASQCYNYALDLISRNYESQAIRYLHKSIEYDEKYIELINNNSKLEKARNNHDHKSWLKRREYRKSRKNRPF